MIDDVRYLLVFAKIVATGSISAAAEALQLSAATVSSHLHKLEHSVGTALLYRNTRKLSLTPDGAKLYATAQVMAQLYTDEVLAFKHGQQQHSQQLRIGLPSLLIHHPEFNHVLAAFIRSQPQAHLDLCYSDARSDLLDEGLDVVLRIGELPDSSFKAKNVFSLERILVAQTDWLRQQTPVHTPSDLATYPWLGLQMLPQQREFQHVHSHDSVTVSYSAAVTTDNVAAAYQLARAGVGVYTPPRFLCAADLQAGVVCELLPLWRLRAMKVYALWPNNVATGSLAHQFIHSLQGLQAA